MRLVKKLRPPCDPPPPAYVFLLLTYVPPDKMIDGLISLKKCLGYFLGQIMEGTSE